MESNIRELLEASGVASIFKIGPLDFQDYIKSKIVQIIYYSSAIEGNKIDADAAEILLNNDIVSKDGRFQDYIEILRHGEVYKRLIDLSKRPITVDDMIELRSELFNGILGKYKGLRRYRNGVGEYITSPASDVEEELTQILKIINTKPASTIDAFLSALEFHLRLVHLHPFEDGVGRTTRLFMNLYLMKSRLAPILLSSADNKSYRSSLSFYHFTGLSTPFIANMLAFSIGRAKLVELSDNIRQKKGQDPLAIGFSDMLLQLSGSSVDESSLIADTKMLYKAEKDESSVVQSLSALWLGKDPEIIRSGLDNLDYRVRAGAMFAAERDGIAKYAQKVRELALSDENAYNKILAMAIMARAKMLDPGFVEQIAEKEKSEVVLCGLGEYMTWVDKSPAYLNTIRKLMKNESVSIKARAYEALVKHADDGIVTDSAIEGLVKNDAVVQQSIIGQLKFSGRIFNPQIAAALSVEVARSKEVSDSLLGAIASTDKMSEEFTPFLDNLIKSSTSTKEESAYAAYLIGIQKGSTYLKERYNLDASRGNSLLQKVATFLAYAHELERSPAIQPDKECIFGLDDDKLSFVQQVELARLAKMNRFGTDFLELCLKDLRQWDLG